MTRLSSWGLGSAFRRLLGVRLGRLRQYAPRALSVTSIKAEGDNRDLPRISLVTPSFNQARYIGGTVRSVLEQAYPNLEYVVQDACSTDGTADVLHAFLGAGVDMQIESDDGQADALNKGFSRTAGEVMGYLNSDDLLLPGALHLVGRCFRDNPSVDVIYGNRLIIDENGMEIGRWILPRHDSRVVRFVDYIPQESMFWRRAIWDRMGARFDDTLEFAMDWELILRFIDGNATFRHIPALFGVFRAHGSQKSQADFMTHGAAEMTILRSRYREKNAGRIQRMLSHWRFLAEHKRADADFARTLSIREQ